MSRVVLTLIAVVLFAGCGSEVAGAPDGESAGSWTQLPDAPLSPRENVVAVAVDNRVLVVGGSDAAPCPPGADCATAEEPALRDGAVFDLDSDQWQSSTDAPLPIEWAETAVVGSSIYFWVPATGRPESHEAFVTYDIDTDEWAELPLPPNAGDDTCCAIAAAGDQIVAYPGSDEFGETADHIFDPAPEQWTELPADPLSPTFDRVMVWSGTELVHFGSALRETRDSNDGWSTGHVAALDVQSGQWRRLPDAGAHIVDTVMVGGQIVNPWLGASGGDDLYGWTYDVPPGELAALPDAPREPGVSNIGVIAAGEGHFAEDYGWVLDLDAAEWGWIEPRPGTDRGQDGPYVAGVSTAALGESMFAYGGVRWDDWEDSDPEWLDEAWLWHP